MAETSLDSDFSGDIADVEVLDEEKPRVPQSVPAELVQMAAFMTQKQAGSTIGPVEPSFFQTFRIRLQGDVLASPFTQHPWVFAGINRIATDASSVPFVILTEAPEGQFDDELVVQSREEDTETGTPAARRRALDERRTDWHEARRPHFDKLRHAVPRIPEWFHDHYERAPARKYFGAIRARAPEAPIGLVCKATGVVVVEEGPWVELFDTPNSHMTRSQLWESTCIYLGEGGECFWILEGKGDDRLQTEVPTEIVPTGRTGWEPVTDKETRETLVSWKRRGRGKDQTFKLEEVIQFRYFNPEQPLRGLAPIKPADLEIKQDHRASLFNNAFFVHGAQLGGVLTSDKTLNPRQVKEIREQFEARHGGVTKAFKTAVLEGGVKFTETGVRQRDMQFVQLRNMSRDIILAVLGVPKSEVGVIEDVNRATAIVSKRTMWENTILPKLTYIEDLLWSHLFRPTTGENFWGFFDVSQVEALRDDLLTKTEVFEKLVDKGYPINVVAPRLEMGLPAVPWGNVWWSPNNLVPVSSDPTEIPPDEPDDTPPDDEPPDEPPADDDAVQARLEALEGTDDDTDPDEILSDIDGLLEDGSIDAAQYDEADRLISLAYDDLPEDFEEQNEKRWERWEEIERQLMTPGERKIRDAVAKNLFQIRRRQMKLFNQIDLTDTEPLANAVTEPDQVLFLPKEFREKLRDRVKPIYRKLFDDSFEDAEKELEDLGFPEDGERATDDELVPNILPLGGVESVRADLLENQQRRIMQTVDTVRNQLRTALRQAIDEGLTKAEARTRLKKAFGLLRSKPRIIGSTESSSLVNGARWTSFIKRRVPQVEWLSAKDEIVRREHVIFDRAGARPLGHNWAAELGLEGVITIRRPLDPAAPARLVINCFPEGTPILTFDGEKPIESIRLGDMVLTHAARYRPVVNLHVNHAGASLLEVCLDGGRTFRITPSHKLFVIGKGWVEARRLQGGDELVDEATLFAIHDSVGEIEHPHPELREASVTIGLESGFVAEDFYADIGVRQEKVHVVPKSLFISTSIFRDAYGVRAKAVLRNNSQVSGFQPSPEHDLARRRLRAVAEMPASFDSNLSEPVGLVASSSVGVNPLSSYRIASISDGNVVESHNLGESPNLAKADLAHEVAEARHLANIAPPDVFDGILSKSVAPSRYDSPERVHGTASPGTGLYSFCMGRPYNEDFSASRTAQRNSHDVVHGNTVVRVCPAQPVTVVYNLGVLEDMSYFAAGFCQSNCRCVLLPSVAQPID